MSDADRERPTIAIAHDYLTQRGGAERVVLVMARAFPGATIYTTIYDPERTYPEFRDMNIVTSPLNRFALFRRNHRLALPLLPFAANSIRPHEDVVITSSSGWAHGFDAAGHQLVYCHNPARWLYQTRDFLGTSPLRRPRGWILLLLRPALKRWDRKAAAKASKYLANSTVVRQRVKQTYGIEATLLPAPYALGDVADQQVIPQIEQWAADGYYLVVSRLLPYKNVQHVIDAFCSGPGLRDRLVVVGSGPMKAALERRAGPNVRLLSELTDGQMRWVYAHCRAVIAPSYEDYGLSPLEAAAFGKPTLALGAGGYLDTVAPGVSGTFFTAPTASIIRAAVQANASAQWDPDAIRAHVERFGEDHFRAALHRAVDGLITS